MRLFKPLFLALLGQEFQQGLALPENPTDDQVQAEIDAGTFKNPSVKVRPRFRYWIPDASADLDTVADDVKEIGRIGASGFELLGFYLYGGPPLGWGTSAPVDWAVYGWGTKAWHKLFKTFSQATKDNGLIMDFATGPNQGQGVPAHYDDEGKAWDLGVFEHRFQTNDTGFDGVLDGWGTGPLEAAVLAGSPVGGSADVLDDSTLKDLTGHVTKDGKLKLTLESREDYNWVLFSVYLKHSQFQAQDSPLLMGGPQTEPESWVQNGSWAVDHFSPRGARLAQNFFEENIMTDGVLELVREVGNYVWEDSIELKQDYRWTKGFLDLFQKEHRYEGQKHLPIMLFGYNTDQWDEGERYRMDYRTTLATAYGQFLEEWTRWTNEFLHMQYSCQVSYGVWMDELVNIPKVNAPEDESLEFDSDIDRYRQYAGPANLAGKRVISNELGGEIYRAFQQTLPQLLDTFKRAVAGGVNQAVIHGSPYSGSYPNTTWPGMMTFGYQFADGHSRHQPAWDDYSDFMDNMARHQYIFQSGIPRRDVLFWEKRYWFPGNTSYPDNDLVEHGFSYEYLSPNNFELPAAEVVDGVFAPSRQAFKVLVVQLYEFLTLEGVSKLAEYAHAGLPIVFHGGVPSQLWSYSDSTAEKVNRIMHGLTRLHNVHVTELGDSLADALVSIGIEPRTKVSSNGTWHTVWREDTKNHVEYVFVYNEQGNATTGTVEFTSTKTPYFYDAWTGEQTPVALYERTHHGTKIPFTFQGNQSAIVAFLPEPLGRIPSLHATSVSDGILSVSTEKTSLSVKAGSTGHKFEVKTSDGHTHHVKKSAAEAFELGHWQLTVERWDPPEDLYDAHVTALKSKASHKLPALVSWQEMDGLKNVSGRGHYTTRFTWPPRGGADGAFLDLGRVVHTMTLSVNGKRLPPLDASHARVDIGPYLRHGKNEIDVVVATTLINVLRPIWSELRFSGTTATKNVPPAQEYGLTGPVVVTPYRETLIRGRH